MTTKQPALSMIVAMAHNRMIGGDGDLMWRLPVDWAHFKGHTVGKVLIMGRITFESLGQPLKNRTHVVVSSQSASMQSNEQVVWVQSLDAAVDTARKLHTQVVHEHDEIMILGGGTVYTALLSQATKLYITKVDMQIAGDTQFPDWISGTEQGQWKITEQTQATDIDGVSNTQVTLTFETWQRG